MAKEKVFKNKTDSIRISNKPDIKKISEEKQATVTLINSKTLNQPVEVTVTGIEPVNSNSETVMTPVSHYHGWKIVIPREMFLTPSALASPDIKNEADVTARLYRYNSAQIDIIPIKFDEKNKICIASRVEGMKQRCEEMWFAKNIIGDEEDYLIQEDSRVEARVVNVVRGAVFIEVFGVETGIPAKDVAWYRIENCRDKYKTGDTVYVIIKSLQRDEELRTVSFQASIKDAYADPRILAYTRYVKGGIYEGKVTMINTNVDKKSGAFIRLGKDEEDKIDVYCSYPDTVEPHVGDTVSVGISYKDETTKRIWGNILHIDRQSDR